MAAMLKILRKMLSEVFMAHSHKGNLKKSMEERLVEAIEGIRHEIHQLNKGHHHAAKSARLYITDSKGNRIMPATLSVGQTAVAVLHEFSGLNGTGAELAPVGPVTYASSDVTIATVDPTSGLVTAVAPGTATITGTDAGNGLSASDSVSDSPLVAQSATLVITAQ